MSQDNILECVSSLKNDLENYEYVVVCIGEEVKRRFYSDDSADNEKEYCNIIGKFAELCGKCNYFFVSTDKEATLRKTNISEKRISCPLSQTDSDLEEKQWDFYNKWLASSMAKSFLVIELGENFNNPNVFRWPFERVVMINNKAKMYRVSNNFYQVPEEISGKSVCVFCDAGEFLENLI